MLTEIRIRGYKNFTNVTIPFNKSGPSILFGRNGVGKSNVVSAIKLLGKMGSCGFSGDKTQTQILFNDFDFYGSFFRGLDEFVIECDIENERLSKLTYLINVHFDRRVDERYIPFVQSAVNGINKNEIWNIIRNKLNSIFVFQDNNLLLDYPLYFASLNARLNSLWAQPEKKRAAISWINAVDNNIVGLNVAPSGNAFQAGSKTTISYQIGSDKFNVPLKHVNSGVLKMLNFVSMAFTAQPGDTFVVEELDFGLHPISAHLPLQLSRYMFTQGVQVIGVSNNLGLLSDIQKKNISEGILICMQNGSSKAMAVADFPDAKDLVKKQGLANLYSTGWFEDVVNFGYFKEAGTSCEI